MAKPRLMIVEDETLVALSLNSKLLEMGYEVTAMAEEGEEALRQVESASPDLVLMDVSLKGALDGIETAERRRADFGRWST